jgi:protein CpxP
MKSIRKVLAGGVLAAGALLATAAGLSNAVAQTAAPAAAPATGGPHHWHHHGGQWHLLSQLGLSAEQTASIKSIMTSAGPQMKTIHQQMQSNSQKLMQVSPTDQSYQATVAEVSQSNATLHGQMVTQKANIRAQVFKVLTPAQQQQLQALEAQMMQRMAQRQASRAARGSAAPAVNE